MAQPETRLHYYLLPEDKDSTISDLKAFVRSKELKPNLCCFIFPGNTSDSHTQDATLYSLKPGAGLAGLGMSLHRKGWATLGLPTTGMEHLDDEEEYALALESMAALWKAAAYGIDLILPVRPRSHYFSRPLKNTTDPRFAPKGLEPAFWGGIQGSANPHLAGYYVYQLELLKTFIEADDDKKPPIPEEFRPAYQEGREARSAITPQQWFIPLQFQSKTRRIHRASQPVPEEKNALHRAAPKEHLKQYQKRYKAQQIVLLLRGLGSIIVGTLLCWTILIPKCNVPGYLYTAWKKAKENRLIKKIELSTQEYQDIKETRKAIRLATSKQISLPSKLPYEKQNKPHKAILEAADPKQKSIFFMDREQERRLRYFTERHRRYLQGDINARAALSEDDQKMLLQSKEESIRLGKF